MNNYNQYSDSELLVILKEPSPLCDYALNALWDRYSDRLRSYCLFKSDSVADAEEIFQDTWIRFFNSVKSGNIIKTVRVYLYKIAYNLTIEKYRKKKAAGIIKIDFDFTEIPDKYDFLNSFEKNELLAQICIAAETLDDVHKESFLLHWFSGLAFGEISEITSESRDCIRMRCNRAMEKVIKHLEPIIKELSI